MMNESLSVLIPDGETALAVYVAHCLAQVENVKVYVLSDTRFTWSRFSRLRQLISVQTSRK